MPQGIGTLALLIGCLPLALAGCGGTDDAASPSPEPTSKILLLTVVESSPFDYFFNGDDQVCVDAQSAQMGSEPVTVTVTGADDTILATTTAPAVGGSWDKVDKSCTIPMTLTLSAGSTFYTVTIDGDAGPVATVVEDSGEPTQAAQVDI